MSAFIGYSKTHTERLFKRELGMSPAQFILKAKLEEAKDLLRHTDKPISEISSALCFMTRVIFSTISRRPMA